MGDLIPMNNYNTIIIGAGAAGLMCAIEAGKRGRSVLLIDHANNVGEKIRISGGGRCNFTNVNTSPNNFISQNPRFCISALKRYTPRNFIELVKKYNISYHEKTLGQLFCDGSSTQIINMLLEECRLANVQIQLDTSVTNIAKENQFIINTSGQTYQSESFVIATGGPSIPKMGATGFGYDIAKQFRLNIIDPHPALVPFTLGDELLGRLKELSGVSLDVVATCNKKSFKEAMLFTHRGLSGPAILQISSYWKSGDAIYLDMAPGVKMFESLKDARTNQPKQELHTVLSRLLPKRLAQYLSEEYTGKKLADLSNKHLEKIATNINNWQITPSGTEGFRTAEVTAGGVDTDELSSKTFECTKVPGLYFIGEVVDVTGHLGGFNFQWAWASGYAAGQVV
jgi:predicted Rossmann fold flavoprotein